MVDEVTVRCQADDVVMEPTNPIAAVTHANPYPYYESLLDGPSLYFDQELRMWVAAHANSVSQVFLDPCCRVRPVAEPVPAALEGRPAGEIFRHLVRMIAGDRHDRAKLALERALSSIPATEVVTRANQTAEQTLPATLVPEALTAWVYETPVAVVADLLGLPPDERSTIACEVRDFVASLSPLSTPDQLVDANTAALRLRSRLQDALDSLEHTSDGLMSRALSSSRNVGWTNKDAIVSNLVGLLSQSYEATAGLIGNSIVALASQPRLLDEVRTRVDGWQLLVLETSRYESPVQNTRRFVVESTSLGGIDLKPGAAILLVLGAANRDPRANPEPERFLLERANRSVFTFGRGTHACPGEAIARGIAACALSILDRHLSTPVLARLAWTWKPSTNGRLPIFQSANTARPADISLLRPRMSTM
jgi:cytochrome P450